MKAVRVFVAGVGLPSLAARVLLVGSAFFSLVFVGVVVASGNTEATAGLKVSDSDNVSLESAIAVSTDEVSIIWAGNALSRGIYLARGLADTWVQSTVVVPTIGRAWNPAVTYVGSSLAVAWTQGEAEFPRNTARSLVQKDLGAAAEVVVADVYGDVAPHFVNATNGMHMVFAAATEESAALNAELYYTYRASGSTSWSSPEKIAGYDAAPSPLDGIWRPRIAANDAGTTIHVVWERTGSDSGLSYSAWHLSGTRAATGNVDWGTPEQLSPADQQYAMRPDVAMEAGDVVHVVWTEVIPTAQGGILPAEAQHINHWRSDREGARRINTTSIRVNSTEPTWTSASIAANDELVCVAWHGYAPDDPTSKEEVTLRCSRDGGAVWLGARNLSQSSDWLSLFPSIALDTEGFVHASWVEESLTGVEFLPVGIYYGANDTRNIVFLPLVLR